MVNDTVIDLGTLNDLASYATGINNAGRVVGYTFGLPAKETRAVLFSGTGSDNIDLGTSRGKIQPRQSDQ
ncbi:MAG TPA: hypothetical protein VIT91_12135 [Chthoniobacterales bacterium]